MILKIFNTRTKKKETFQFPLDRKINIYVCGVTVYDLCHIGHARTFIIFDLVIRYLKYLGYKTYYVRNITDIDDKIINKSIFLKQSISILSKNMISEMKKDFYDLNLIEPNEEPRVTESITDILYFIETLIRKKHAYISKNKDVLFSIKTYPNYGTLSNRHILNKKEFFTSKYDFVLWKNCKNKKKKPFWDSPWGPGRPGWHIECSSIRYRYFKNKIDIHGGGLDLLFPHHENEDSQSICFSKKFFVNFWMHVGFVNYNNKKMSKSLGNIITIRSLLKKYNAEVIRYFLYSTHYRHPLFYTDNNLFIANTILTRIYKTTNNYKKPVVFPIIYNNIRLIFKKEFYFSLNDDFNTPKACSLLYRLSQYINRIKKNNLNLANILIFDLLKLGKVIGFFRYTYKQFIFNKNFFLLKNDSVIKNLIKLRNDYRKHKQWKKSDEIRDKLLSLGISINDKSYTIKYI